MDSLTKLVDSNSTAHKMFLVWALRYRNRNSTHIGRFRAYLKRNGTINEREYTQTFLSLQLMGMGSIEGNKFKWNVPLKQTALNVLKESKGMVETRDRKPRPLAITRIIEPNMHTVETDDYLIKITVQLKQNFNQAGLTKHIKLPRLSIKSTR